MASFNRDKYRASSFETIRKQETSLKKADKKFENNSEGRARFYILNEGRNVFHIMPSHTEETAAYVPFRTAMLPILQDEYEDGEKTGRKVLKNKRIFIATQHCQAVIDNKLQDPIEYYIDQVYEKAEEFSDDKDKEKFLAPIKGGGQGKGWRPGILPSSTWVCYALEMNNRELCRLELRQNWFTQLQKKSMELAEENDEVSLDMFSSPDTGFPLIITKGEKQEKNRTRVYYDIDAGKPKMGQDWSDFFETIRITDEELQHFEQQPSLKELYIDSYTSRDLDLALEGLKNLEKAHPEYDILGSDEFEELVKKLRKVVPVYEEKKDDVEDAFEKESSEEITPLKMKKFLREYIAENYEGYSLPSTLKGDELKEWYELAKAGDELPFEDDEEEEEEDEGVDTGEEEQQEEQEEDKEEEKPKAKQYDPSSTKQALKDILNRRK